MQKVKRSFLLLTLSPQGVGWEWAGNWEWVWQGQLIWTGQRAITCLITSCPAIKLAADISPKVTLAVGLAGQQVFLWEVVNNCLWITWGFFIRFWFSLLFKLSLSSPMSFSHFCSSNSLPIPPEQVIKELDGGSAAGWGQPTTVCVD